MKRQRKLFGFIWIALGIIFFAWIADSYQAKRITADIFQSSSTVTVMQTSDAIIFTPAKTFEKVLIFYPGALVDPDAYAPLCRKIAENGYKAMIIKMPWCLASWSYHKPIEMRIFDDKTKRYLLAGHSHGAKMAATFVYENPGLID